MLSYNTSIVVAEDAALKTRQAKYKSATFMRNSEFYLYTM